MGCSALGCAVVGMSGGVAHAAFPEKTVTVIVPQAAGTEVDWMAREYGVYLANMWKVPVVVENRTGAGGDIGTGQVARAAPDGYTLLFTGGSFAINAVLNKTSYDPVRSFTPVMHAGFSYFTLTTSQELGVRSAADFVKLAKERPGHLNYGSPGAGSVQNLAMELFKRKAGIDVVHVPYKGASTALNDLAGGTVDATIVSAVQVTGLEQEGKVRILMTISPTRDPRIPDVPTAAEAGFPDFKVEGWSGILAPAGTPKDIVQKINADLNTVRALPSMREAVIKRFGGPEKLKGEGTPQELGDVIESDLKMWRTLFPAAQTKG
jgi:tripartite-type tricarboxylate transporter receptor subunit TctC